MYMYFIYRYIWYICIMINVRNIFCICLYRYEKYMCFIYINYFSFNRCGLFDLYINMIGKGDIFREVNSFFV